MGILDWICIQGSMYGDTIMQREGDAEQLSVSKNHWHECFVGREAHLLSIMVESDIILINHND